MLAYLFPGQGSQARGMGAELFDLFKDHTAQADEILGYSIKELCLEDKHQQLNQTQFTQPALYTVNALMYLQTIAETRQIPDYVAGHSLGEYSALFAAGVFDFATGLALVQKRGELMSQAEGGGMAAVLGLDLHEITQVLQQHELSTITVANYNSYQQLVISGPKADIERSQTAFSSLTNVSFIPLSVSGAFHSSYMLNAQQSFASFLQPYQFAVPTLPIIANVDAMPYHPAVIKTNLTNQITHPVEWVKTIEYLQRKPGIIMKEIGPGKVLSGLVRRISNKQ